MKVLITRHLPEVCYDLLDGAGFVIDYHDSEVPFTREELMERVKDVDAIICLLDDIVDASIIGASPSLKVIANYAVGYNNVDVGIASAHGIWVTNTPDVLTHATADLTMGLLLTVARRIVESHNYLTAGKFKGWGSTLLLGAELHGKQLGIIGAGRIGTEVAKRGLGFGLAVAYFGRNENQELDELGCTRLGLDEILSSSDFVSLHLPLTKETKYVIDQSKLEIMKPGSYLINTGRGGLIDESALVSSLQLGKLAGAALDVFENEPQVHSGLLSLDNVVLLPHIGSATIEARNKMAELCARSVIAVLSGDRPDFPVNSI